MRFAVPLLIASVALLYISISYAFKRGPRSDARITPLPATPANLRQATFAAGCFWGVEEAFRHVTGVVSTAVGYTGGHTENPTYQDVCTDQTGHAEAVLVTYDPSQVTYEQLLDVFWSSHDPTTKDRQGPDWGTQYRSAIFYHDPAQEKAARASLIEVEAAHYFPSKIVTEIIPAGPFYPAEDYHQQYFAKNGGTCHVGPAVVHTQLAKNSKLIGSSAGSQPVP
jgi:peptide-methionine (S)-S-oxide reductase